MNTARYSSESSDEECALTRQLLREDVHKMPNVGFNLNNFKNIDQGEPIPTNVATHKKNLEIIGWKVSTKYEECFLPIIEDPNGLEKADVDYVWCAKCRIWIKTSGTSGNINAHYTRTKRHPQYRKDVNENQYHGQQYTIEQKQAAAKRIIVTNGLAKRLIEDPDWKILVPDLPCRRTFGKQITEEAEIIRSKIKDILSNVDSLSLSMDEWTSISNNRYLGITCAAFYSGDMQIFTLGHVPLVIDEDEKDMGIKAADIGGLLLIIIGEYQIENVVSNVASDNDSVMIAALKWVNNQRNLNKLPQYLWTPCICHTINLIVAAFIGEIEAFITPIKKLQKKLGKSANFKQYLISKNCMKTTLPSYIQIRWYSLCKLLKSIVFLRRHIIQYCNDSLGEHVEESIFDSAQRLATPFQTLKRITQSLESDSFGTLSIALFAFSQVHMAFNGLDDIYHEAVEKFNTKYNDISANYKGPWGDILFAATILNPKLKHKNILSTDEWQKGIAWLRKKVEDHKAEHLDNIAAEAASQSSQGPSAYVENQTPRIRLNRPPIRPHQTRNSSVLNRNSISRSVHSSVIDDLIDEIQDEPTTTDDQDEVNEYLNYLGKPYISIDMWKNPPPTMPNLGAVAQKVLSMLTSSASTERQFSKTRRILGYQRLRLLPNHVEDETIIVGNPSLTRESFE